MLLDNYISFLDLLTGKIRSFGIDVSHLNLDHFGYQASSDQDYDRLKLEFEKIGKLLSEEIVGGRRVGIFEFLPHSIIEVIPFPPLNWLPPNQDKFVRQHWNMSNM